MTGRIWIEAGDVFGLPAGAKHLYLVYREFGTGAEYVIRSGPDNRWRPFDTEMEIETNVPIEDSADDRGDDTPEDRSSTLLSFPVSADAAWSIMVKYCRALEAADYRYDALRENSNAFVCAMLHAAGGEPGAMLPDGVSADEAVGFRYWDDIVADVAPPRDAVFRGTAGADRLSGLQMDEIFALGAGGDVLHAGRGNDRADAGGGDDRAHGQLGADRLDGGTGRDWLTGGYGTDRLAGGGGADTLDGGPGGDTLIGGAGADVFDFGPGSGDDVVVDFQDGIDRLRIAGEGVAGFRDLEVGRAGSGAWIKLDGATVVVRDLDPGSLDAGDVIIAPPDPLLG